MNAEITGNDSPPRLIVIMGIPASGKTTFYNQVFAPQGVEHINLDTLRTRNREMQRVQECVASKQSFAVDNTNTLPQERERYISIAQQAGYRIEGYFLQSRIQDCINRNSQRDSKVPVAAITAMSARLVLPNKSEGFDALYFVNITEKGFNISPWKETT